MALINYFPKNLDYLGIESRKNLIIWELADADDCGDAGVVYWVDPTAACAVAAQGVVYWVASGADHSAD